MWLLKDAIVTYEENSLLPNPNPNQYNLLLDTVSLIFPLLNKIPVYVLSLATTKTPHEDENEYKKKKGENANLLLYTWK